MPVVVDPIVLDPVEFLPNAAELDLSGAGLRVLDANFGDADVELEMQRQTLGEVPTTYHPPNTTTVLALGVRAEEDIDLPTAAHQLAAKVGEINTPGTEHWLRRAFEVGGSFAGSLGRRVYKATLSGLGAWQRGESPDVVLTLVTGPYWYATLEEESGVFTSEEGARELIFELAEVLGTAPGLIRIRINNEGEADWRGVILAGESRDHPQDETADTTAALAYGAQELTLMGGAVKKEREGLKVVRHEGLTPGWMTILDTEIVGIGHMTHKGVRRPWMRIWDPGSEPGEVQLRARWRVLGSLQWSKNAIVSTPLVDDWALIDLGEVRPEPAALGDERWQLQVQARALSGAGIIDLQRFYPLPTEQFAVVKAPSVPQAAEFQSTRSPSTVADDSAVGSVAWTNPSNAKASDNTRASVAFSGTEQSHYLEALDCGFAIPSTAQITGVIVCVEKRTVSGVIEDASIRLLHGGSIQGDEKKKSQKWPTSDTASYYGSSEDTWGIPLTPAMVNASSFGAVFSIQNYLAGAGLAEVDAISILVFHSEENLNRVTFAGRSSEFRPDGIFRQHLEDDVWGELIPEGFLPFAVPSGLEGRKSRFILIPSQGDLGDVADSGSNPLSAQAFVRPAYLVAREAA